MPTVLLIRHGLTPLTGTKLIGWTPGVHLSDLGREQAEDLATRLDGVRLAAVYSSPLERCRETAAPVAKAAGHQVKIDERIGEVRYGKWQGKTFTQLSKLERWREVHRNPTRVRFPGGETLLETQQRAVAALEDAIASHPKGTIALFSHGDCIRVLLAHCLGIHLDLYQRLGVAPASISAVAIGRTGHPAVLTVNDLGGGTATLLRG